MLASNYPRVHYKDLKNSQTIPSDPTTQQHVSAFTGGVQVSSQYSLPKPSFSSPSFTVSKNPPPDGAFCWLADKL